MVALRRNGDSLRICKTISMFSRALQSSMAKPKRSPSIRVIDVAGSPSSIGKTLGRSCRNIASAMLRDARLRLAEKGMSWSDATSSARKYRHFCEEFDPDFIEWIEGYALGSGFSVYDLHVLICEDEKGFCTDIAANGLVTDNGSVLHAHTEDWRESSEKYTVIVRASPKHGPAFVAATLGGLELICGMNSAGMSYSGNSLYPNDERVGIPKLFQARRLVTSRSIGEAIESALPPDRGSSYNVNLCHKSGEMYCVEGSATSHALLYARDGYLVHTNHYLAPAMSPYEAIYGTEAKSLEGASGSIFRYHRALRLTQKNLGGITKDSLKETLSDHVNSPSSICNHPKRGEAPNERSKTTFAVVFDLTHMKMDICMGNPCTGRFVELEP
jgi:isopenicillin-N N-acyltransferase-like protein